MCEISVVMPVYNAEMHIKDAIESVLEHLLWILSSSS